MKVISYTDNFFGSTWNKFREKTKNFSLFQAARDGQLEIVSQHIYAIGKDKKKLNRKDQDQTTALHYAVRYGHYNIVKMLVENGASKFFLLFSIGIIHLVRSLYFPKN